MRNVCSHTPISHICPMRLCAISDFLSLCTPTQHINPKAHPHSTSVHQQIPTAHHSTSQHITAHPHSTSQHITAHHTSQQHITAHPHSTSQHITAHHSTSQRITAHHSTSQHIDISTSHHISTYPHSTSPHSTSPHSTSPQHMTPHHPQYIVHTQHSPEHKV